MIKTSKTIKDYKIHYKGYDLIIPKGSTVSNQTACGTDDNYRFWIEYSKYVKEITKCDNSLLLHDLTFYGLNIPEEYCEPYN